MLKLLDIIFRQVADNRYVLSALIQLQDRIDGENRMSANNKMIFTMHCMIVSFYKFVESPADKRTKN
ncbi:Uncharacterised protein [Shigella sonnei]|nr:Uncharacterised protein [Shigella sonnei]